MTDTTGFAALERREWSDPNVARAYAQAFAKASDMVVPALVAAVRAGSGTRALDLCCGHGNVSAGLVGAGAEVTGVDFSPAMLEMARIAVPGARFVEGDAMALEFEDGTFDAVLSNGVLLHLELELLSPAVFPHLSVSHQAMLPAPNTLDLLMV